MKSKGWKYIGLFIFTLYIAICLYGARTEMEAMQFRLYLVGTMVVLGYFNIMDKLEEIQNGQK